MTFKICAVLGAQGIRAMGFRRAQGNQHCAKFESHANRVTFETNAIRMTSSIQAHYHFVTKKLPRCKTNLVLLFLLRKYTIFIDIELFFKNIHWYDM